MNELELALMFFFGILAGMFISFLSSLSKFNKAIDAALEAASENDDSIQAMHEKTGWLNCLSFLINYYR